jgi:lipopolysaccharide assembly outer membrane protein LptD (OstA)
MNNFVIKILFGLSAIIIIFFFSLKLFNKEKRASVENEAIIEEIDSTTNIIKDVSYSSTDAKGNEYILNANEGQIDLNNDKVIFLNSVKATIIMATGEIINIQSKFGKYNINNYDTIFSENVLIEFEDNKIKGNYVDFSLNRNSLIISKNVVYLNQKNLLRADVVEINISTKDAKIFMYEEEKKVKIKSN